MCYCGEEIPMDFVEAARWFLKAAEQGDPDAQFTLGRFHFSGIGVKLDYAEAVHWFRKAAEQNHVVAQYGLAIAYYQGKGTTQDNVRAHMWMHLAATNAGDDDAKKYAAQRDALATQMKLEELIEAQDLASSWLRERSQSL
jgi:TPR repeat protein